MVLLILARLTLVSDVSFWVGWVLDDVTWLQWDRSGPTTCLILPSLIHTCSCGCGRGPRNWKYPSAELGSITTCPKSKSVQACTTTVCRCQEVWKIQDVSRTHLPYILINTHGFSCSLLIKFTKLGNFKNHLIIINLVTTNNIYSPLHWDQESMVLINIKDREHSCPFWPYSVGGVLAASRSSIF